MWRNESMECLRHTPYDTQRLTPCVTHTTHPPSTGLPLPSYLSTESALYQWLDSLKPGGVFSQQYSPAFAAAGFYDLDDLTGSRPTDAELRELLEPAGAMRPVTHTSNSGGLVVVV